MNFPSPSSAEAVIAIQDLSRQFGAKRALDNVSALFATLLLCAGWRVSWLSKGSSNELFSNICVILMGTSLAAVFILFRFTESDRRQRFTGFPTRLFTLPVRTVCLVTWPMVLGSVTLVLVYLGWATLLFAPKKPDLLFPSLYLVAGMICFQAIVWAFAAVPITRLVMLGFWGAALTTSWIAFSPLMGQAQLGTALAQSLHLSVRAAQIGILATLSVMAHGLAWWSVERQRRGTTLKLSWPRLRLLAAIQSWLPAPARFASPRAAQFWFEWRRNGMALPLIVGVLLALITGSFFVLCPFVGRAEPVTVMLTLFWILVLPFALAFIIGQAFGKTNLWGQGLGKDLGVPLFLAVRPLSASDWLAVKLKTAAVSSVVTWLTVAGFVLLWLGCCCDCGPAVSLIFSLPTWMWLGAAAPLLLLFLALAMLLTWRLLVANLYLGVLTSRALLNTAFCLVFVTFFAAMVVGLWLNQPGNEISALTDYLPWLEWALTGLVLFKFGLVWYGVHRLKQRALICPGAALKYFAIWIWCTTLLLLLTLIVPATDALARVLGLVALLAFPLARISLAPLLFVRSKSQ